MNLTSQHMMRTNGTVSFCNPDSKKPYKNNRENVILRDWLNGRYGRGAALREQLYPNDNRHSIHKYKDGEAPVYKENFHKLKCAMLRVQWHERQSGITSTYDVKPLD